MDDDTRFRVRKADSLQFDNDIHLTEREKKTLPFGFNSIFRESGWKGLRAGKTEAAIRNFQFAHAAVPNDHRTLIGRGYARVKNVLFTGALYDAEAVLRENEFNREAIYIQALCQYELGCPEEGLVMYRRGINKRGHRRRFDEGKMAVEATMENVVGRHAGPMLTDLEPIVHEIKDKVLRKQQREEEFKPPCTDDLELVKHYRCREEEWNLLTRQLEKRKTRQAAMYLGKLSEDLRWCNELGSRMSLKPNKTSSLRILRLAASAQTEMSRRLAILQARKPLYHFHHLYIPCRKQADRAIKENTKVMRATLIKNLEAMFQNLVKLRRARLTKECLFQAERIKKTIENAPNSYLKFKSKHVDKLSELMGKVYLDRKTFLPNVSKEVNIRRIELWLGIHPLVSQTNDPVTSIIQESDFPYFNQTRWMKTYKDELDIAQTDLERAWLHHEMSRLYINSNKYEHACMEAGKCATLAKACGSKIWEINGLFMKAITETMGKNKKEANATLKECINVAIEHGDEWVIEFLLSSKAIIRTNSRSSITFHTDPVAKRETAILKLMHDPKTKEKARVLLTKMKFLPEDRVMSIVPGERQGVKTGFKSAAKSIIPGGSGGRLGFHPITNESYYEFLGISQPSRQAQ